MGISTQHDLEGFNTVGNFRMWIAGLSFSGRGLTQLFEILPNNNGSSADFV